MKRFPKASAFTLVELMVATTLLSVLLIILASITNQTSNTLRYTTSKVEQFKSAREAFEAVTRRLSQATLNTYWDYEWTGSGTSRVPSKYVRQSELRFWSGATQTAAGATPLRPGHGVFFQAPLGFVNRTKEFGGLDNLLNTWGYYVEFNNEDDFRPPFVNSMNPPIPDRYRYRLMELMQPSNEMELYSLTAGGTGTATTYTSTDWIKNALAPTTTARAPVHILSENVISFVLLPKLSEAEDPTGVRLAPGYSYDSTVTVADPEINPKNQLPPLVQVTMVAIDETSAARVANGATLPDLGLEGLFQTGGTDAGNYDSDLEVLTKGLSERRLNYRVFSTHVSIRAAKWSRD